MSDDNLFGVGVAVIAGAVIIKGVKYIQKEVKQEKKKIKQEKKQGYGLW